MNFKDFIASTPARELAAFARRAKTTVGTLRHLAGGYRTGGKVRASPQLARRIDIASDGAFPRETLCEACRACEYAKQRQR